jgi:hypothetical protein
MKNKIKILGQDERDKIRLTGLFTVLYSVKPDKY